LLLRHGLDPNERRKADWATPFENAVARPAAFEVLKPYFKLHAFKFENCFRHKHAPTMAVLKSLAELGFPLHEVYVLREAVKAGCSAESIRSLLQDGADPQDPSKIQAFMALIEAPCFNDTAGALVRHDGTDVLQCVALNPAVFKPEHYARIAPHIDLTNIPIIAALALQQQSQYSFMYAWKALEANIDEEKLTKARAAVCAVLPVAYNASQIVRDLRIDIMSYDISDTGIFDNVSVPFMAAALEIASSSSKQRLLDRYGASWSKRASMGKVTSLAESVLRQLGAQLPNAPDSTSWYCVVQ
jgi:hypothetical protein